MHDIRTLLHDAAPTLDDLTVDEVVEADLTRGRRALVRRRARRLSVGSTLAAAAVVGAFVLVAPHGPARDTTAGSSHRNMPAVALVAYTGDQPVGYTLDSVPTGWVVDDDSPAELTLVPKDKLGEESAGSFVGKIAITLQPEGVPDGVKVDQIKVGSRPAVIAHLEGGGDTRELFVKARSDAYLAIQVWDGLGWDNTRIAEFAASVHVTKNAEPVLG